jgi:two-component system cell cycle response regulator
MPGPSIPTYLLASAEPALLASIEPLLADGGARVEVHLSAEPTLAALTAAHPPELAVLDAQLPGMEMEGLLAAARAEAVGRHFPIVLISETVSQAWIDRLAEGIIDDLVPRASEPGFLRVRLESVLRTHRRVRELEELREAAMLSTQTDHLTGAYNRETILSMLFRETDRVQRMKSSLCMILFDIDDFGHWNSRLGSAACDDLLRQTVTRTGRLLRSYDLLGRAGKDEFLIGLPGCTTASAQMLVERLRSEVFSTAFRVAGETIRLSACFGVATSLGRSPVVVLREAEQALERAKAAGPDSILCAAESPQSQASPAAFLATDSGDELLAW